MRFQAIGIEEARAALQRLGDGLPAAMADGLNRTMAAVEQAQLNAMETHLDRPTPFTLNALRIFKANPRHLDATLFVLPDQAKYLRFSIEGGKLDSTIVPFAIRRDAHGNIPGKKDGWRGMARGKNDFVTRLRSGRAAGKIALFRKSRGSAMLLALQDKQARREKRLPYYETAEKVAADRLRRDILAAIDAAAKRS